VIWLHHSCLPSIPPAAHTCIAPSAYIAHCGFSRSIGSGFMARRGRGRRGGWRHPRINFPQSSGQYFHGAGDGSLWQQNQQRSTATNQCPRQ